MLQVSSLNDLIGQVPSLQVGQANQQPVGASAQIQAPVNQQTTSATGWGSHPQMTPGSYTDQVQPQGAYEQQQPQVGVAAHNLGFLAQGNNPPRSAYDFTYGPGTNGPQMHMPAYSGSGWTPNSQAVPMPMPQFPQYQHLAQIGR